LKKIKPGNFIAIHIHKPTVKRDWSQVWENITLAVLHGVQEEFADAVGKVSSGVKDTIKEFSTDEIACTWLYASFSAALYSHHRSLPEAAHIEDEACRARVTTVYKSARLRKSVTCLSVRPSSIYHLKGFFARPPASRPRPVNVCSRDQVFSLVHRTTTKIGL